MPLSMRKANVQFSPSSSLLSVRYLSFAPLGIVIKTSECERSSRLMQIYSAKDRKREFFGFEGSHLREIKHRLIFSLEGTEAWDFISNLSIPLRNIVQYPAGFSLLVLAMLMKFEWICARKEKVISLISRQLWFITLFAVQVRNIYREGTNWTGNEDEESETSSIYGTKSMKQLNTQERIV